MDFVNIEQNPLLHNKKKEETKIAMDYREI